MSKLVAAFAIILILTGVALLALPKPAVVTTRGADNRESINVQQVQDIWAKTRDIAEKVNAPLSILFGLLSLYYTRRTYVLQRGA